MKCIADMNVSKTMKIKWKSGERKQSKQIFDTQIFVCINLIKRGHVIAQELSQRLLTRPGPGQSMWDLWWTNWH
jgi:hypothetical protein